ncbi:MAG: hypothetical protein M3Z08_05930 [Chloroflexota bacterium]|nr:hypothetical protein [Chloroflexota bacterium]
MGVERAVTRWHVQYQKLMMEVTALEAKLAPSPNAQQEPADQAALAQQLAQTQRRLRELGPCPKPMMG